MNKDYVARCPECGGVIAMADATTKQSQQLHKKYAERWEAEGRIVAIEEQPADIFSIVWCKGWLHGGCKRL